MKIEIFLFFLFLVRFAKSETIDAAAIVQKGNAAGATACMSCHGAHGEGNLANGFPRLANLPALYLAEQLNDYASGARNNAMMGPIAKALTPQERSAVADYYFGLTLENAAAKAKSGKSNSQIEKLGEQLANKGNQKMQLQACANCHGPSGHTQSAFVPSIAGQPAAYIKAQLSAWKSGERKNSANQMVPVVVNLDQKSIEALAAFFSTK